MPYRIFTRKVSARALLVAAAAVALSAVAAAQNARSCALSGQIAIDGGGRTVNDMTVELEDARDHMTVARIPVSPNGDFQTDRIPAGDYEVRLRDGSGLVLYRSFATVGDLNTVMNIRLSNETKHAEPVNGTVSVAQLKRKIPSTALKEFEKAQKASAAGDIQTSIAHLEKAIEIDPSYMEAYNNLGVRYLKLNQYENAAKEFQKATELDQNAAPAFLNLSIACFSLDRLPEAEKAARSALRIESTNQHTRLMLGLVLFAEKKDDSEALGELRAVEKEFTKARVAIAQILARRGDNQDAIAELKSYLETGHVANPQQVQTWIAELKAAPGHP